MTPGFAFVAEPLDRADEWRGDAGKLDALRATSRCLRLDARGYVAVDGEGRLSAEIGAPADAVFLGRRGDDAWFAAYSAAVARAYPPLADGSVLMPMPRLFVLVRKVQPEKVLAELGGLRGRVLKTSLSPEQESKRDAAA